MRDAHEVGLRVVVGARYRPVNQYDPDRLYRLAPGTVREFRRDPVNGGERIVYRINDDGYRVCLGYTLSRGVTKRVQAEVEKLGDNPTQEEMVEAMRRGMNARPAGR